MAPGSLALEIFRRGSLNHSIHCANQMIHWTAWSNFLSYMTQVIKAFTWNFFQAILLPINQSSIRLVTSVLNETIFTKYLQQRKPRNLIFNKKIKKYQQTKEKNYTLTTISTEQKACEVDMMTQYLQQILGYYVESKVYLVSKPLVREMFSNLGKLIIIKKYLPRQIVSKNI